MIQLREFNARADVKSARASVRFVMKFMLQKSIVALGIGLISLSAFANEGTSTKSVIAPDKKKVSYAMGMNLAFQRQEINADIDTDLFIQGMKDALQNKLPKEQESEVIEALNARISSGGISKPSKEEKAKISYGLGMRLAGQLKNSGADVDADIIAKGLKDVLEGKPTKLQRNEIQPLFEQAREYGLAQQAKKNRAEGEAFLKKNAKEPGIKILPDGLQYRVLREGTGPMPQIDDQLYIKYRGKFVDGTEFNRHSHFLIRCGGGIKGWQDALPRMKVGSKWQIFVPPDLGFGEEGEPPWGVGPDATLVFELEVLAIAPSDAEFSRGRLGHALEDSDIGTWDDDPPAKAAK